MKDFKSLTVWAKAHQLALAIYETTRGFPKEELYGLTSQLRRAASTIPTNIAEGCGSGTQAELARYLQIAAGSSIEVEYLLLLSRDLSLINKEFHERLTQETMEVRKMLSTLIKKIKSVKN